MHKPRWTCSLVSGWWPDVFIILKGTTCTNLNRANQHWKHGFWSVFGPDQTNLVLATSTEKTWIVRNWLFWDTCAPCNSMSCVSRVKGWIPNISSSFRHFMAKTPTIFAMKVLTLCFPRWIFAWWLPYVCVCARTHHMLLSIRFRWARCLPMWITDNDTEIDDTNTMTVNPNTLHVLRNTSYGHCTISVSAAPMLAVCRWNQTNNVNHKHGTHKKWNATLPKETVMFHVMIWSHEWHSHAFESNNLDSRTETVDMSLAGMICHLQEDAIACKCFCPGPRGLGRAPRHICERGFIFECLHGTKTMPSAHIWCNTSLSTNFLFAKANSTPLEKTDCYKPCIGQTTQTRAIHLEVPRTLFAKSSFDYFFGYDGKGWLPPFHILGSFCASIVNDEPRYTFTETRALMPPSHVRCWPWQPVLHLPEDLKPIRSFSESISWEQKNRHRIWPGEGSTVQWKWSPPAPGSLKALLFPPLLNKVENRGTQGVRARYDAELPPIISIVRYPGRPVILVPEKKTIINFTVELNRERPVCPRDGSHFVPGRGPICPKDGSCLSRTPSRRKCLCLLIFSCPNLKTALAPAPHVLLPMLQLQHPLAIRSCKVIIWKLQLVPGVSRCPGHSGDSWDTFFWPLWV